MKSNYLCFAALAALTALTSAASNGCGGASTSDPAETGDSPDGGGPDGSSTSDGGTVSSDGGAQSSKDSGGSSTVDAAPDPVDGTPVRNACTNTLGNGLTSVHGRLDGTLVSIVPTTEHNCNGDSTHVHLQVLMNDSVYDIAVNTDGLEYDLPHAMVDGAWAEGWHPGDKLDYPSMLGVHFSSFKTTNAQAFINDLANVNHISVFATGYGPDGAHLIHRENPGESEDGAVITDPLGASPHFYVFRFDTDSNF